jgi:hypothetical protein
MDFVLDASSTFRERKQKDGTLFGVKPDGIPVRTQVVFIFLAPLWDFFFLLCAATLRTAQKGTVPAMADISSLLSLLEDKHRQAKQQCDDEKARNIDWLEETVANTKKQLLHRL